MLNALLHFRVSMGHEDVQFNARSYIDIMYLDGKPVLHVVDESTHFSAASFLTRTTAEAVWEATMLCWSSVYTGHPNNIMADDGSQFCKFFAELAVLHDEHLEKNGTETSHALGIGEQYHRPLRDPFRKLNIDYPKMQPQLLLSLFVKTMNDTLGLECIVPSALVFGELPSLCSLTGPMKPRPSSAERAEAVQ